MMIPLPIIRWFWSSATWVGMRRIGDMVKNSLNAYSDTIFYWDDEAVEGYVALTIDDGLCRDVIYDDDNNNCSMVKEIQELLKSYNNAHATFFVCTDYATKVDEIQSLIGDGHEFGNHLQKDIMGYYNTLSKEEFRVELLKTNSQMQNLISGETQNNDASKEEEKIKWFRAPNGRMNEIMKEVIKEESMIHVLGDCYCDDWAFSQNDDSKIDNNKNQKRKNHAIVAPLMLRQMQSGGSIAIFHMPERGFRESSLIALKEFLDGTRSRNIQCITLSEMQQLSRDGKIK